MEHSYGYVPTVFIWIGALVEPPPMSPVFHWPPAGPPVEVDVCAVPRVLCQATVLPTRTVWVPPNAPGPESAMMLIVTSAPPPPPGPTGFDFFLQDSAVRPSARMRMASRAPTNDFMKRTSR